MNHHTAFTEHLEDQHWMSEDFRRGLIARLSAALEDAHQRGAGLIPPEKVGGVDRIRDLNTITNYLLQTAQVDISPADTSVRMEELSEEGVLTIISYPPREHDTKKAQTYAQELLSGLDAHLSSARVG
tara:strand:- start:245 stop:628 length:384 start_codon:yes stop_codon:yes gene_type:complete